MTLERIGVITGAVVSVGAILAGLGYGWPWYANADGIKLADTVNAQQRQMQMNNYSFQRGLTDEHVNSLLLQKSILIMQKAAQAHARDFDAAAQTQARIDWLDWQIQHPEQKAPPAP